ncbi:MAG: thiamine diphosphokinase [Clostridiales bacterium]|nr:thiamine diphosphokinase [Clostridiales bacterium]
MGTKIKSCVIISGAPESDIDYIKNYIDDSYIIAADSGYEKCQRLGINPDLIVGDFDSSNKPDADCEIITLQVRKDDTDTFHCVRIAVERGFNDITVLGGIGSRVDHTYSNILSLVYCDEHGVNSKLVNPDNCVSIIKKKTVVKKSNYKYFSLFALFEKCEGVSIEGAEYNLNNESILPSDQFTQSNAFKDGEVTISLKSGKLILIQSND